MNRYANKMTQRRAKAQRRRRLLISSMYGKMVFNAMQNGSPIVDSRQHGTRIDIIDVNSLYPYSIPRVVE